MNWINIKDKLPKDRQDVVIWVINIDDWYEACFLETYYNQNNRFVVDDERDIEFSIEEVSHWMIPTKPIN